MTSSMEPRDIAAAGIHPVELCVYSILSNNLDGIYQSINELRESQALLILRLKQIRGTLKNEHDILTNEGHLKNECERLDKLKLRVDRLVDRYDKLLDRSKKCT